MTNLTGKTLSHYRVEAKIGAGGMGEVYRGIDTRLNRPVAVKLLPPDLLQDDDRRRRFTHEAKSASALNHPNIVTIYDVGSDAGIDFMVMEYVAGKTLEEIIGRRPMAITLLLRHATQIAEALTAAHAAGIVHRDLKPTNVMVTDQGLVKVLDFGLAKLAEGSTPDADGNTRTAAQVGSPSERGMIVGTASYMSPEQAEGGIVDARSDIFSFGSMLYEMATGRRAFEGSTTMSTIAAVLRDEPPRPSTLTAPLPHDLEVLINRCLKKDPSRRVQHMADLKVALQELKEDSESGRLMTSVAAVPAATARRPVWPIARRGACRDRRHRRCRRMVAVRTVVRSRAAARADAADVRHGHDGAARTVARRHAGRLRVRSHDEAPEHLGAAGGRRSGGQAHRPRGWRRRPDVLAGRHPNRLPAADGKDTGVYVVATIGGEPRKIVSAGYVSEVLARWISAFFCGSGREPLPADGRARGRRPTENRRGELRCLSTWDLVPRQFACVDPRPYRHEGAAH